MDATLHTRIRNIFSGLKIIHFDENFTSGCYEGYNSQVQVSIGFGDGWLPEPVMIHCVTVLTHFPLVPHIYAGELGQHWFR